MLRRLQFLCVGILTLGSVLVPPNSAHAQHGRGGSHAGSRSSFRPGFQPGFRGFSRREFDSRFSRFDRFEDRFERQFSFGRFDRFEDRLERRSFFGPLPHVRGGFFPGFGFPVGGFGFPWFY
jgi:hypothetical protein